MKYMRLTEYIGNADYICFSTPEALISVQDG